MTTVPTQERDTDESELEEAEWTAPASSAASDTSTFTGDPVRANIDPAWAANASGIIRLRRWRVQLDRGDDNHRNERGDGPVDADERRQPGTHQHHQHEQPALAVAGTGDELLPGPRRDAGGVERFADHEQ